MKSIHTGLPLVAMLLLLGARTAAASPSDELYALIDEQWETSLREQVFYRTDPDAWRMNGKLAEYSADALARRQSYNDSVLQRLAGIDSET